MDITKDDLEKKYNSMKNEALADELGVSIPTLMKLIDDAGIKRKGPGNAWHKQKVRVVK